METKHLSREDIELYRKDVYGHLWTCLQLTYEDTNPKLIESKIDGLIQYIDVGKAYTFGAIEDNRMVGFLWGYPVTSFTNTVFHIAYIAVEKRERRQGIGKRLIFEAENIARELGINHIELIVGSRNKNAISFYGKEGYEEDRLIMRKRVR